MVFSWLRNRSYQSIILANLPYEVRGFHNTVLSTRTFQHLQNLIVLSSHRDGQLIWYSSSYSGILSTIFESDVHLDILYTSVQFKRMLLLLSYMYMVRHNFTIYLFHIRWLISQNIYVLNISVSKFNFTIVF